MMGETHGHSCKTCVLGSFLQRLGLVLSSLLRGCFSGCGHQNGKAHLRVPPCTWVRKTLEPRKKRAAETPLEEVEEAVKGAVSSDADGGEGAAQAVTGSCASALWE